MVTFIRAHLNSPMLTPDNLARAHFISRRKLYEIFEKAGEGPADFIRRERIQAAARALEQNDTLPIASIAFDVGFADVTTFTRAFRRYFGATPTDWRRRLN